MYSRHGCDDYSLQSFLLEHLVVVLIQPNPEWLQVLLSPLDLIIVGCACCDEFCSGRSVQEAVKNLN